jgi:hypothetical protein
MAQVGTMSVEALIRSATTATQVLRQVTTGKAADAPAGTTVHTLQQLGEILERMSAELAQRRRAGARHEAALMRIAGLKVRGAGELIEQGRWKKLAEELQAVGQSAIDPEGAGER